MATTEAFRDELLHSLEQSIDSLIDEGTMRDLSAADAATLARGAMDGMERVLAFRSRFGMFHRTPRVQEILGGVSRQAVSKLATSHRLLRVVTEDGVHLFPAFQFVGGRVDPVVRTLVGILGDAGMDGWTILYWLTTPVPALEGRTALEAITGTQADLVEVLARDDASRWVSGASQR